MKTPNGLLADTSGATALEYGLIVGLIALVIIAGLTLIGPEISNTFNEAGNAL